MHQRWGQAPELAFELVVERRPVVVERRLVAVVHKPAAVVRKPVAVVVAAADELLLAAFVALPSAVAAGFSATLAAWRRLVLVVHKLGPYSLGRKPLRMETLAVIPPWQLGILDWNGPCKVGPEVPSPQGMILRSILLLKRNHLGRPRPGHIGRKAERSLQTARSLSAQR